MSLEFPNPEDVKSVIYTMVPDGTRAERLWGLVQNYGAGRYWTGYEDHAKEEQTR